MTSATVAVTLSARRQRQQRRDDLASASSPLIFVYTTAGQRSSSDPDGLQIAAHLHRRHRRHLARLPRSGARPSCARPTSIFDETARALHRRGGAAAARCASSPTTRTTATSREYLLKEREEREASHIPPGDPVLFLEVTVGDASEFAPVVPVTGEEIGGYRVLRAEAAVDPQRDRRRPARTSATGPASGRTSTSAGPRATRSSTWPASSSSARATSPRSPTRSCARPSPTRQRARPSTSAKGVKRGEEERVRGSDGAGERRAIRPGGG